MGRLSVLLAASAIAMGGCAAVSGLGDYKEGSGSSALESGGGTGLGDNGSDAADPVADGGTATQSYYDDVTTPTDPAEGSSVYESGALPDIQYDAPPACGPATC